MRRDELRRADDVAQPLAEFAQLRAVLDLDEDGPDRRSDRARDGGLCLKRRGFGRRCQTLRSTRLTAG